MLICDNPSEEEQITLLQRESISRTIRVFDKSYEGSVGVHVHPVSGIISLRLDPNDIVAHLWKDYEQQRDFLE